MKPIEHTRCATPVLDPRGPAASRGTGVTAPSGSAPVSGLEPRGWTFEVRATERESFTEYHLTGTAERGGAAVDELLAHAAAAIAERRIQTIQEKFYGRCSARAAVLRRREEAYRREELDLSIPVTWIEGAPLNGNDFGGFQIWGITPRDARMGVTTVTHPTAGAGRLWTGRGFRLLHLASVRGVLPGSGLADGPAAQADQMFTNAELGLDAFGLEYRHVARTWIYLSRLLEWYGDFNRVRTAHYQKAGFSAVGGLPFPASTGIQGRSGDEECVMDLLALQSDSPARAAALPIRRSPRQDPSFVYGSAFSRGVAMEIEGRRTVHVSGTASINSAGASVHVGDAEMQSLETLLCIAAILEEQGGSLENITSATLFCKTPAALAAWTRVTRSLRVPAFPRICVLADVCRDDLLVEMEAVATI